MYGMGCASRLEGKCSNFKPRQQQSKASRIRSRGIVRLGIIRHCEYRDLPTFPKVEDNRRSELCQSGEVQHPFRNQWLGQKSSRQQWTSGNEVAAISQGEKILPIIQPVASLCSSAHSLRPWYSAPHSTPSSGFQYPRPSLLGPSPLARSLQPWHNVPRSTLPGGLQS